MSELKVDKITPRLGTTLTLGDTGDTINFGSGVLPNFENLTVTGDLTVDTNSLKVDSTNNFVGIGTASPSVALDVVGAITATGNLTVDTNTLFVNSSNNRVGIGTTSPASKFEVEDSVNGDMHLRINNTNTGASARTFLLMQSDGATGGIYLNGANSIGSGTNQADSMTLTSDASASNGLNINATTGSLKFYYNNSETMRIDSSGRVGIANTIPGSFNSQGDDLVIGSGSTTSGMTIYSGTTSTGNIFFADGTGASDNVRGGIVYDHNTNQLKLRVNDVNRIEINSSGQVGIGTNSPSSLLDLVFSSTNTSPTPGNSTLRIRQTASGTNGYFSAINLSTATVGDSADSLIVNYGITNGQSALAFFTDNLNTCSERMRIDQNGNVGIGTTSPSQKLEVSGNILLGDNNNLYLGTSGDLAIYHNGSHSFIDEQGTGNLYIRAYGSLNLQKYTGENMIVCNADGNTYLYYDNSEKLRTTGSGVTVTGTLTETSSIAYKENIQPLEFNEAIYNVNAVKYDRKDGSSKDEVGVIAEELYEILPDLVETKEGKPDSVKYTKLTMYLLEALKKQNEEIQELKKRLN